MSILDIAKALYAKGITINGAKDTAKVLNALSKGKQYSGGRGSFNAIASSYKKEHNQGDPDSWMILDVFRGKNGEHLWKK